MEHLLFGLIGFISLLIGVVGIVVIVVGCTLSVNQYFHRHREDFSDIRLMLSRHLLLGLDFLVAKDVIDTLLLDSGAAFWEDLVSLIVVVIVRIVLTHFAMREMKEIDPSKSKIVKNTVAKLKKKTPARGKKS